MPPGRLRPAGARHPPRPRAAARGQRPRRRHHPAQPVRPQPALRLRRPVRLRGRLPHRRASGRRALPRPGPARRAARPRRAPRAARPGGADRGRGRAAVARHRPSRPQRRGASPTCCACSVRCRWRRSARGRSTAPTWRAGWPRSTVAWPSVRMAGDDRWTAIEDIGRLRDGLGVPVPVGTPDAFSSSPRTRSATWSSRYARSHGPFTTAEVAARLGLGEAVARQTLQRLAHRGRVLDGEFRPSGSGTEWCDAEVLRKLRRRSLARLRQEVEPVSHDAVGRFLPAWQHVGGTACAASTGWSPPSTSSPGARCRPARSSRWCSPPACATTSRRCSTSSPRPARSSGPATPRCPAATAGSASTSPTRPT